MRAEDDDEGIETKEICIEYSLLLLGLNVFTRLLLFALV